VSRDSHRDRYVQPGTLVPSGADAGVFDHEDYGATGSSGAVDYSAGDDEGLAGIELDGLVFEIDEELAFDGEEELVVIVVLVPVVFAFDNADADDGVVDHAKGLVEPHVFFCVGDVDIDDFEREMEDVEPGFVREGGSGGHGESPCREDSRGEEVTFPGGSARASQEGVARLLFRSWPEARGRDAIERM
jgi:hypothetical protein